MSKEDWIRCYERAEAEAPEGTSEETLCREADERCADLMAARIDLAEEKRRG